MERFIEIVAPYKKECFFVEEAGEGGIPVLKSESKKREVFVVAKYDGDIPCVYVLASSTMQSERVAEVDGNVLGIHGVKYFKAKTFFKKDMKELEDAGKASINTFTQLSLEFGSAAFTRKFKKRKQISEITKGIDSKSEILMQTIAPSSTLPKSESSSQQPDFPVKNTNASSPMDVYSIRDVLGFDPYSVLENSSNIQENKELNLGDVAASVLEKKPLTYAKHRNEYVWAAVFDSICKLLALNNKNKLSYIYEIEEVPQVTLIKQLVCKFIGPKAKVDAKLHLEKRTKMALVTRLMVLLLLKNGGTIDLANHIKCLFGFDLAVVSKIMAGLGCKKSKSLKIPGATIMMYTLRAPKA
ncbi:uncharacterized protein NEMAJ01_1335 [Nematocida major]|uniref:uncharacterized protein n=1 Tax=Nematocida major TaxID=1912982 RepID=UPI0020083DD1|nr:uncharacterized protein NEMAJ01_1335 [Nematocida major]KAH9386439.1 hypothetical protein NEMAJ01_1335 [Nematocida major]